MEMVPRIIRELEDEMGNQIKINDNYVVMQQENSDDQCKLLSLSVIMKTHFLRH